MLRNSSKKSSSEYDDAIYRHLPIFIRAERMKSVDQHNLFIITIVFPKQKGKYPLVPACQMKFCCFFCVKINENCHFGISKPVIDCFLDI